MEVDVSEEHVSIVTEAFLRNVHVHRVVIDGYKGENITSEDRYVRYWNSKVVPMEEYLRDPS